MQTRLKSFASSVESRCEVHGISWLCGQEQGASSVERTEDDNAMMARVSGIRSKRGRADSLVL